MTTEPEREVQVAPVVAVATDLTAIVDLHERLLTQAVNDADNPEMPGGRAMVSLAYVGSLSTWTAQVADLEQRWIEDAELNDVSWDKLPDFSEAEDDSWEPPLQTLLFWSEQWRAEHNMGSQRRPTIASEANFIRWALNWAWDNEVHFADFARDIETARRRIEDTLCEGARSTARGVPCLYDECKGARLVRKTVPTSDKATGKKAWQLTDWHCPKCHRSWDEDAYDRQIYAAIARSKVEHIDGETWCTVEWAAQRVKRPQSTIRAWVHRGQLTVACMLTPRREEFVNMAEVEARHNLAVTRHVRWLAAVKANRREKNSGVTICV